MDGGAGAQTLGQTGGDAQHIKRQIYNVSAGFEASLPQAAHVVRLRAEFSRKLFVSATSDALKCAVRDELHQLFSRADQAPQARVAA